MSTSDRLTRVYEGSGALCLLGIAAMILGGPHVAALLLPVVVAVGVVAIICGVVVYRRRPPKP